MAELIIAERSDIVAIADAVRNKTGKTDELTLGQIVSEIDEISGGEPIEVDSLDNSLLVAENENKVYKCDGKLYQVKMDYPNGLCFVEYIVPLYQEKTATENGEVLPDEGYDGLSKVIVAVEGSGGSSSTIDLENIPEVDNLEVTDISPTAVIYDGEIYFLCKGELKNGRI